MTVGGMKAEVGSEIEIFWEKRIGSAHYLNAIESDKALTLLALAKCSF